MRFYHRATYEWERLTGEEIIYGHSPSYVFSLYTIHQPPYPQKLEEKFKVTLKLLEGLKRFADGNQLDFYVLLIPTDAQVHPEMWKKWRALGANGPLIATPNGADEPQARLGQLLSAAGIQYLDLLPAFRRAALKGETLYFPIDGHWNVQGHRLAAESLAEAIMHRLRSAPCIKTGTQANCSIEAKAA